MEKLWIFNRGENGSYFEPDRPVVEQVLARRGMTDPTDLAEFLAEKPGLSYDPLLMKDMEAAAERLLLAAERGERVCIYGDYDADGVTGVSLLLEILAKLGLEPDHYIPSRFDEGYGLNLQAVEAIHRRGAELIVTVDCGSVSYAEVERARELGMEVIITDHHNIPEGEKAPDCLLVNPKQRDCPYPFKELCGCGVAFKLAEALRIKTEAAGAGERCVSRADLGEVLDLAAIATIGDIVSLQGENRTITKYGMRRVNSGRRPGLRYLTEAAGLKPGAVTSENVAFVLVPHLNAAGRMDTAEVCITLLTSRDEQELRRAAEALVQNNKERRRTQEETLRRVLELVKEQEADRFLLVDAEDAHEGITGIVAGKVKDRYCRPVALVTDCGNGMVKGTGRSVEGVDLHAMLWKYRELLDKFGGHAGACGFSMKRESLDALRQGLCRDARALYEEDPTLFVTKLQIDGSLLPAQVDRELAQDIGRMAPFGRGNPKPLFAVEQVEVREINYLGVGQHVRFTAGGIPCIFFNQAQEYKALLESGRPVDIAGCPDLNVWNGTERVQFLITDIR